MLADHGQAAHEGKVDGAVRTRLGKPRSIRFARDAHLEDVIDAQLLVGPDHDLLRGRRGADAGALAQDKLPKAQTSPKSAVAGAEDGLGGERASHGDYDGELITIRRTGLCWLSRESARKQGSGQRRVSSWRKMLAPQAIVGAAGRAPTLGAGVDARAVRRSGTSSRSAALARPCTSA